MAAPQPRTQAPRTGGAPAEPKARGGDQASGAGREGTLPISAAELLSPMSAGDPPKGGSNVQRGGRAGYMCFFICSSAFFSSRDTCACEIPISPATSIWVRPWKNRSRRISRSRSVRRFMASFTPM